MNGHTQLIQKFNTESSFAHRAPISIWLLSRPPVMNYNYNYHHQVLSNITPKAVAVHNQFLTAYTILKYMCLHCRIMTKNNYHQTDNYHVIYLREISWKGLVMLQMDTRGTQFNY